jgi:hypothetical protein
MRSPSVLIAGDPLERLAWVVDFEIFRSVLDAALARSDRSRGGRPHYDAVMMFRILVLQALYSSRMSRQSSSCGAGCPSCALQASGCTRRCRMPR